MKQLTKKCNHYWHYEHTVYGEDNSSLVSVHRQCSKCKIHQVAKTKAWHKPHKNRTELPEL